MWLTRIFKKKYLIWMIIIVILIYCALTLIKQFKEDKLVENIEESATRQTQQFNWYNEDNETETHLLTCRNSIQGKIVIADDRGFLCKRTDVLALGCCNVESPSTKRYSCDTCKSNDCCSIYEYCISCCMNPEKRGILQKSLVKVLDRFKVLYGSVNDQFDLCLVKCRTSSQMEKKSSKEWEEAKSLIPEPITPLYNTQWLNECCELLYRPGSHLHTIVSKITKDLAPKLESQIAYANSEQRKQVTYSLLGLRYVTDHISDAEHYDPTVLETLSTDTREALDEECKALVLENAMRLKETLGFSQNLSRYSPETPMGGFLKESGVVLHDGVEKQLRDGKKIKITMAAKEKSKKAFTFDGLENEIWETRADILAQVLVEVTYHEPERIQMMLRSFRDLQLALPSPISNLLKKQFLLRKEKQNFVPGSNLRTVENKWREEFVKRIHHNTNALKVDRAIKSPLWQQIDNAVIEIYGRVPSLVPHDTDDHQLEASRVLNILQVYNKAFDPILVLWLFPLQINLSSSIQGTDSHVMELAMYLDLVHRHCIPSIDEIFSMADQVVNTWKDWDRNLFSHVQDTLTKNVWINIKDFPSQILHPDRSSANKLGVKMKGRSRNDIPPDCLDVFVDPRIFIRKWIIEGFAGILNRHAIVYAWDQLFFGEWNPQIICDLCLAILFLMTRQFAKAKNYFGIREIFVLEPGRLYTADIRQAHVHVQRGNSFDDIPDMNRKTPTKTANHTLEKPSETDGAANTLPPLKVAQ